MQAHSSFTMPCDNKVMRCLTLILIILLSGCSTLPKERAFAPYLAAFEQESGLVAQIAFSFGVTRHLDEYQVDAVAECVPGSWSKRPEVKVNLEAWKKLSDDDRLVLIFHELGHCQFSKMHGKGLMQPALLSGKEFRKHREALLVLYKVTN